MPITVKTMRDIWDKERKKEKRIEKYKILSPDVKKYYFEYLARRRVFLEIKEEIVQIFSDYESRLGEAGFFKI